MPLEEKILRSARRVFLGANFGFLAIWRVTDSNPGQARQALKNLLEAGLVERVERRSISTFQEAQKTTQMYRLTDSGWQAAESTTPFFSHFQARQV